MTEVTNAAYGTTGRSQGSRWTRWIIHALAALTVLGCFTLIPAEPVQAQATNRYVDYYGGWCRICSGQTYACSNGHGSWQNGQRSFRDPVGSGNYVTRVRYYADGVWGCSGRYSYTQQRLNSWHFYNTSNYGQCRCNSCDRQMYAISPYYSNGIPGYRYNTNNTVYLRFTRGVACVARVRVYIEYRRRAETCYRDYDGDGYGDPRVRTQLSSCSRYRGWVSNRSDCNDRNRNIRPGAREVCNGVDDDCDGARDEGLYRYYYYDRDRDSWGRSNARLYRCSPYSYYTATRGGDCNDGNNRIYPGAREYCNNIDDDCDGTKDEGVGGRWWYYDRDNDRYGTSSRIYQCSPYSYWRATRSGDCRDDLNYVNPGRAEVCGNRLDDNCNGQTDENMRTYYRDADSDGWGNRNSPYRACSQPRGYTSRTHDCDDGRRDVYPGRTEVCDGRDNDCDGAVDEGLKIWQYLDADRDGYGRPGGTRAFNTSQQYLYSRRNPVRWDYRNLPNSAGNVRIIVYARGDIDHYYEYLDMRLDGWRYAYAFRHYTGYNSWRSHTFYISASNWNARNGDRRLLFDAYRSSWMSWAYVYLNISYSIGPNYYVCRGTPGYSSRNDDCNDGRSNVHPGHAEVCGDGLDNNCNGQVDENIRTFYRDADGDGYGRTSGRYCTQPRGWTTRGGDCDDNRSNVYPGAREVCDNLDNDCDGTVDEGLRRWRYRDADLDGYGANGRTRAFNTSTQYLYTSRNPVRWDYRNLPNSAGNVRVIVYARGDIDHYYEYLDMRLDGWRYAYAFRHYTGYNSWRSHTFYISAGNWNARNADRRLLFDAYRSGSMSWAYVYLNISYSEGANYFVCNDARGYADRGGDCDDRYSNVRPGHPEICGDGRDNNCNGQVDENKVRYYVDRDRDSYGTTSGLYCTRPNGYATRGGDCNDNNAAINPGAREVCDNVDNNCNGQTDEGLKRYRYVDADRDGYGVGGGTYTFTTSQGRINRSWTYTNLPDATSTVAVTVYAKGDIDYYYEYLGLTIDGTFFGNLFVGWHCYNCWRAQTINVSASNWNSRNRDRRLQFYVYNRSGVAWADTYMRVRYQRGPDRFVCPQWPGYADRAGDCDDRRSNVNPGHAEICGDGLDNNCNGTVDENMRTFYRDQDRDGWGGTARRACTQPGGYVTRGGDCDDSRADVNPGRREVCNGRDDDCNDGIDEGLRRYYYRDRDQDGYGQGGGTYAFTAPAGNITRTWTYSNLPNASGNVNIRVYANGDINSYHEYLGMNIDGSRVANYLFRGYYCYRCWASVSFNVSSSFWNSRNGDRRLQFQVFNQSGVGFASVYLRITIPRGPDQFVCPGTPGYSSRGGDCNDNERRMNPGLSEVCGDGLDNNCNGHVDENIRTFYQDIDGDGWGSSTTRRACTQPRGYTTRSGDCDDRRADVNPGRTEVCNGRDDDCNDGIDEGLRRYYYRDRDQDGYGQGGGTYAFTAPAGNITRTWTYSNLPNASGNVNIRVYANGDINSYYEYLGMNIDGSRVANYLFRGYYCYRCWASVSFNVSSSFWNSRNGDRRLQFQVFNQRGVGFASVYLRITIPRGADQFVCPGTPGYSSRGGDCNDHRGDVHPGHAEVCGDGVDNDCDGLVDENIVTWYLDNDGDGYGSTRSVRACSRPSRHVTNNRDCNDNNGAIYPGAREICDNLDNDCDRSVDEGYAHRYYYLDRDDDNWGTTSRIYECKPYGHYTAPRSGDCNDNSNRAYPGHPEICGDGIDNDCDGSIDENIRTWYRDGDGDGYGGTSTRACTAPRGYIARGGDCDDSRSDVNPGRTEVCNGRDDDCNEGIDERLRVYKYTDNDRDGYGVGGRTGTWQTSSQYLYSRRNPVSWTYTGLPNAAGTVRVTVYGNGDTNSRSEYFDMRLDGWRFGYAFNYYTSNYRWIAQSYNIPASTWNNYNRDGRITWQAYRSYYMGGAWVYIRFSVPGVADKLVCPNTPGYATNNTDCDDRRSNVNPGHAEICGDGLDNNCNGRIDENITTWYYDNDGDGYGNPGRRTNACTRPSRYVSNNRDCNDNVGAINPGAREICDNLDNDCDGGIDEGFTHRRYYYDLDGDTWGRNSYITECKAYGNYRATRNGDCNDNSNRAYPGHAEICGDGLDNNCNGHIDENRIRFYRDGDGDGYGSTSYTLACTLPNGYATNNRDCNDGNARINPGATEICNNVDDDCDGQTDEGLKVTLYRDRDGDGYGENRSSYSYTSNSQVLYYSRYVRWDMRSLPNAASNVTMDIWACGDVNSSSEWLDIRLDGWRVGYAFNYYNTHCWARHRFNISAANWNARNGDGRLLVDFHSSRYMYRATVYFRLYYTRGAETAQVCPGTPGYTNRLGDCNDRNRNINPGAAEICGNRIDDNCNGRTDENTRTFYFDGDRDGYGTNRTTTACTQPNGYATRPGDCNDGDPAINPGRTEICNNKDDNCNGATDEGLRVNLYVDRDRDGYAQNNTRVSVCPGTPGYTNRLGDCDDTRASVNPSRPEVCGNRLDDNCNGAVDENILTFYVDQDGDGFGTSSTTQACSRPNGYATVAGDCNDSNARINPRATEVCDNVDNNCNGATDEGLRVNRYADADRDGFGAGNRVSVCPQWVGYSLRGDDCNDGNAAINPQAREVCDRVDNNCDGQVDEGLRVARYRDGDDDGYGAGNQVSVCPDWDGYSQRSDDCNDSNANVNPGASEICGNDIDDNCNGAVDENKLTFYRDADSDTYGDRNSPTRACTQPNGYVARVHDCDDTRANVNPGATEVCDHLDNDCDGATDEGVLVQRFRDADGDGWGNTARNVCDGDDGYVTRNGDCNDSVASINPGAAEICGNNVDDNCNGEVDENKLTFYIDRDGDNYGDRGVPTLACTQPDGFTNNGDDCDDRNENVNPGETEICNHIDDNCRGGVDEGVKVTRHRDQDGDGYGTDQTGQVCPQDRGWAEADGDCNDGNDAINPGATEVCNFIDDNCDGRNDEGLRVTRYRDIDGDGYGGNNSASVCPDTEGYSVNNRDCVDSNPDINPGVAEICGNNVDDNCDGRIDENKVTFYLDADSDGFGSTTTILACTQPNGYVTNNRDCNDGNRAINPNATEVCDHVDNNCNDQTDEGLLVRRYQDQDGDNYGTSRTGNVCPDDDGWAVQTGDCDDTRTNVNPGHAEVCGDNLDNNCNGQVDENKLRFYLDADSDDFGDPDTSRLACTRPNGYVTDNTDCDDSRNAVNPDATEVCNGIDDNCDERIDEGLLVTLYRDFDSDTFGDPDTSRSLCPGTSGYVANRTDCNDRDATIRPNATEVCDGVDQNCNDQIDEGIPTRTYYLDVDNDAFGLTDDTRTNCRAIGNYRATVGGDCNDRNENVNPGVAEICGNGIDDNCNNEIDENKVTYYRDVDGDTYGNATLRACSQPDGYVGRGGDCNDNNRAVNPGATEVCNNVDDNCNDQTDEGLRVQRYVDSDRDTYGTNATAQVCPDWPGYAQRNGDCDDTRTNVNPGHAEVCGDGLDNNCNGRIDENLVTYYRDEDGDGYGNPARTTMACTVPNGYVTDNTDCNDRSDQAHPGGTEVCDNLDNNCQGGVDENLTRSCSTDCGTGEETCTAGQWRDCDARIPTPEVCDGEDNNCDGQVDGFRQACRSICGGGLEQCVDGDFGACNAQEPETEVCDGVDNDCDGIIDDGVSCGCQYFPRDEPVDPQIEWMWSGSDSHSTYKQVISTPIVARLTDTDDDGKIADSDTPDVLFATTEMVAENGGYLRAVSGADGTERWVYDDRKVFGASSPAVGDINGNGTPEVVAYAWRSSQHGAPQNAGLIALDNEGNELWNNRDVNQGGHNEAGSPAIADIDPNSPGAEIATCFWLVSSTGQTLWNRWNDLPNGYTPSGFCSPVVADIDGDDRMEIIIGARAYNHDGSIAWTNNELYTNMGNKYDIAPAVADLNGDGNVEVVVVRNGVYVLDGATGQIKASRALPGAGFGGAPNLADFDGDGKPDIGAASGTAYSTMKYSLVNNVGTLTVLWQTQIQDFSSATTGSSTFDFNGDGVADVVYNDENYLRVFNGRTGAVVVEKRNWSGTQVEYPVIADVDNDSNAELVVARNQIGGFEEDGQTPAGLVIYGDANDQWLNTRGVWNQYSYHVTNVRDNGFVPPSEIKHWTQTGTNGFRNNFQGQQGLYDAPDAVVSVATGLTQGGSNGTYPDTDVPYCDAYNKITIRTCNQGDANIAAGMEVAIYVGAIENGVVAVTGQTTRTLTTSGDDQCENIELSWNSAVDGVQTLSVKTDSGNAQSECNEDNNVHVIGQYEMTPVGDEKCDNKDNDCDMVRDEDPNGDPLERQCNGEGECGGSVVCENGAWPECNQVEDEICDGLDNDCDGNIDESPDACGDGITCTLTSDDEYVCVEAITVSNDGCAFGCPLGTVCALEDGRTECVPHCESDSACPDGMVCSDEFLCEAGDDGELALGDLDDDGEFQDRDRVETPMGACSAPSFAKNAAPAGGFLLLVLGALGFMVRRT